MPDTGVASLPAIDRTTGRPTSGVGARLTPTKKRRNLIIVGKVIALFVMPKQLIVVQFVTKNTRVETKFFVCSTRNKNKNSMCFHKHMIIAHADDENYKGVLATSNKNINYNYLLHSIIYLAKVGFFM
jgi:hypothetical protein